MEIACPACASGQLLVDGELARCESCGSRFEQQSERLGDGPGREWVAQRLALVLAASPSKRMVRTIDAGTTTLRLRPEGHPGAMGGVAVAALLYYTISGIGHLQEGGAVVAAGVALLALWRMLRRERVPVDGEAVSWRGGLWPFARKGKLVRAGRLELDTADGVKIDDSQYWKVRLRGPDGELIIGRASQLSQQDPEWLATAIRKELVDAGQR